MNDHLVEYDRENGFIFIKYQGTVGLEDVDQVRLQAASLTKQNRCYRSLTDLRNSIFEFSDIDAYSLAESTERIFSEHGVPVVDIKRAIVTHELTTTLNYLKRVADKRGHCLELFHDFEKARNWLLGKL